MNKNWKYIKFRSQSDRGDAILVGSVLLLPLMFICLAFSIDLTKAVFMKNSFVNAAQGAATEAVRVIDQEGDLTPESVSRLVQAYAGEVNNQGENGDSRVFVARSGDCRNVKIEGSNFVPDGTVRQAPYMEISLSATRALGDDADAPTWTVNGGSLVGQIAGTYVPFNQPYRVITAKIWDSSPNFFFGMIGVPCQTTYSDVSAITFYSNKDVEDWGAETPGDIDPVDPWDAFPWITISNFKFGEPRHCTIDGNRVSWDASLGEIAGYMGLNSSTTDFSGMLYDPIVSGEYNLPSIYTGFIGYIVLEDDVFSGYAITCQRTGPADPDPTPECFTVTKGPVVSGSVKYSWSAVPGATGYKYTLSSPYGNENMTLGSGALSVTIPFDETANNFIAITPAGNVPGCISTGGGGETPTPLATCTISPFNYQGYVDDVKTIDVRPQVTFGLPGDSFGSMVVTAPGSTGAYKTGGVSIWFKPSTFDTQTISYKVTSEMGAECAGQINVNGVKKATCASVSSSRTIILLPASNGNGIYRDVRVQIVNTWSPSAGDNTLTLSVSSHNNQHGGVTAAGTAPMDAGAMLTTALVRNLIAGVHNLNTGWVRTITVKDALGVTKTC